MTAQEIVDWLTATGTPEGVANLSRYGIPNGNTLGVPMGVMKKKAKALGRQHPVALELWTTGFYEARTMAVFLADPEQLSPDEADAWCADFDNWAICDTVCFSLLDRTPYRWDKVPIWCADDREFVRRAGFALVWAMTTHDKAASDAQFVAALELVSAHAEDERPLVRKGIDMALRAIGKRNPALRQAALKTATDLSQRDDKNARWIGTHSHKELSKAKNANR